MWSNLNFIKSILNKYYTWIIINYINQKYLCKFYAGGSGQGTCTKYDIHPVCLFTLHFQNFDKKGMYSKKDRGRGPYKQRPL